MRRDSTFYSGTVERTNRNSYLRLKRMLNSLTVVVLVYASTWFLTVCALFVTQVRQFIQSQSFFFLVMGSKHWSFSYDWNSSRLVGYCECVYECTHLYVEITWISVISHSIFNFKQIITDEPSKYSYFEREMKIVVVLWVYVFSLPLHSAHLLLIRKREQLQSFLLQLPVDFHSDYLIHSIDQFIHINIENDKPPTFTTPLESLHLLFIFFPFFSSFQSHFAPFFVALSTQKWS